MATTIRITPLFPRHRWMIALSTTAILTGEPALLFADTLYRYVNEQGVVVYSQSPPAGRAAVSINVAPGPAPADIEAARKRLQPSVPPVNNPPAAAAMTPAQQATIAAMRNKNCTVARENLTKLEQLGDRALIMPDGNKMYPSADELAALIVQTQQQITENCVNPTGE